jgi:hypothetical protein
MSPVSAIFAGTPNSERGPAEQRPGSYVACRDAERPFPPDRPPGAGKRPPRGYVYSLARTVDVTPGDLGPPTPLRRERVGGWGGFPSPVAHARRGARAVTTSVSRPQSRVCGRLSSSITRTDAFTKGQVRYSETLPTQTRRHARPGRSRVADGAREAGGVRVHPRPPLGTPSGMRLTVIAGLPPTNTVVRRRCSSSSGHRRKSGKRVR